MAYACRICAATSFRKARSRSPDGGPQLYRCTGCGVVFADPERWRKMQTHQANPPPAPVAVDQTQQAIAARAGGFYQGGIPPMPDDAFEKSPEYLQGIREAAARAAARAVLGGVKAVE